MVEETGAEGGAAESHRENASPINRRKVVMEMLVSGEQRETHKTKRLKNGELGLQSA